MIEQLRALWGSRDKEQAFVRGLLLTRSALNNHENGLSVDDAGKSTNKNSQLGERWFTLIGHTLFFCKHMESAEYSGALLTDIFSPVIARVSKNVLEDFEIPESDQVREIAGTTS